MQDNKRKLIGCFNKSVLLTYLGIALSIYGIVSDNIYECILMLVLAGMCDLLDGPIAKSYDRTKIQEQFGVQIDSLADIIASLVLPVSISYKILGINRIALVVYTIYILAGVNRLAWFNIHQNPNKREKYYQGVPVTYIALVLPIAFTYLGRYNYFGYVTLVIFVIMAILFTVNIKVKKPTYIGYSVYSILACLEIIYLIRIL